MERTALLQRGVRLEVATVAWNVFEGVIAVAAGTLASSVALIAFGIDSFVETASGAVVGWRLRVETRGGRDAEAIEHLERRAGRIAGALLLGLAGYIVIDAGRRLLGFGSEPMKAWSVSSSRRSRLSSCRPWDGPSCAPRAGSAAVPSAPMRTRPSPAHGYHSPHSSASFSTRPWDGGGPTPSPRWPSFRWLSVRVWKAGESLLRRL